MTISPTVLEAADKFIIYHKPTSHYQDINLMVAMKHFTKSKISDEILR